MRHRFGGAPRLHQQRAQRVVRRRVIALERERALVTRDGFLVPRVLGMKLREPKVRFGGAGLELQHAGVAAGRRRHVAGVALRIAEMQMRLGEIGLEADRAAQMRDRLLVAAERAQRQRNVVAALRILSVRARSPCRSARRRLRGVRSDAPARRDNAGSARASDRSRAPGDSAGRHRRTVRPDDAGCRSRTVARPATMCEDRLSFRLKMASP